ncbi:MAG: VWA domain-containing protein, partial [Bacillota bacterium]
MPVAFDAAPLLAPGLPAPSAPPLALGLALLPALEFAAPWALLVLVPALALVAAIRRPWWQAARRAGPGPRRREAWLLARRALWVSLLILALAGPTLVRPVRRQAVVLVVDGSASTAGVRDRAEAWIREALAALPRGDQAGVVVAADGARVEEPPGPAPVFGRLAARIPQGASDLAAGLQLAGAILPEGYAGRVVVLTDGRSNRGDPEAVARALAARGIPVDVVPLGPEAAADARLTAVSLPELAYAGEESTLTARIETDGPLAARLRIYRDGALVAERPLRLGPGEWTVTVPVDTGPPGLHRYEVSLDPEDPGGDSIPLNNRLGAVQRVEGPPRVLVLTPDPGAVQPLAAALAAGAAEVEVRTPDRAPADLAGWAAYHAVVLADLPARALTPAAQEQLEAYVRDLGRGLVMTGGPRSFGLGGWEGTPVERALPVYMDLRGRGRLPTVALAVVIDKSGSMGGGAGAADKMGLAKEAAVRSVGLLRPRDQVAVIAFDSVAQVVVPLREVGDGAGLREAIGSIYADGGTEIYPALRAAYLTLAGAEADLKHVILLTDGRSGSGGDYGALVRQMEEAGITLSTVAVGSDADTLLLEALAQAGGGRYYFTESPGAIPEIFTRETSLIARNLAVNLRFHPAAAAPSLLLRGLSPVQPLEGYVAVTPKERAEVALVSPEGDPVLAAWQYGAGRAVAWTSDLGGRWAGAWARSPAFATLWGNVLGWVLPGARSGNLQVRADVAADGSVTLTAETPGDWTVAPVRAAVVGPDGHRQEVDLQPAGPGAYRARLAGLAPGAYVATVTRELPGEASQRGEVAWVTPYPAEYRAMGVDRTALERLAAAGQGRVLTDPREAMAGPVAPVRARVPLAPFLLVLAALAWPLEIAGRRLVLTGEDWARAQSSPVRT